MSIVTVALNAARDLPLTLESALAQDHADKEIIVVDGMSWDASHDVLRRYAGSLAAIIPSQDAGTYYAMNAALDHIGMPYVVFMNAGDTFFTADAVSRAVAALDGMPDIFYGNHVYVDRGLELFRRAAWFEEIGERLRAGDIDHQWHASIPCHQATFTSTALLRRLRYDTRLRIGADHDLLFRAFADGARLQYVGETIAHYQAGGISALQGDRCTSENVAIYRRFTDRPEAVDRLFYPDGSPFGPYNRNTGLALAGLRATGSLPELPSPLAGDWVDGDGCRFVAPDRNSIALLLEGWNPFEMQHVTIRAADECLGSWAIPPGSFSITLPFDEPVTAGSLVTLLPSRSGASFATPGTMVSFVLHKFAFKTDGVRRTALAPGVRVSAGSAVLPKLLGSGWSPPEAEHTWSIGPQSDLWITVHPDVRRIGLVLSGNPHVPSGTQWLRVAVDEREPFDIGVPADPDTLVEIDCTSPPWQAGRTNRITLQPSRTATCNGDERDMGVCLKLIELD